jgi:hypothetical protein
MTPEQKAKMADLELRQDLLAQRIRRLADAMGNRAIRRSTGIFRGNDAQDDAAELAALEATLRRLDEVTTEQERILKEAGILRE